MKTKEVKVSLINLCNGAVIERFDYILAEVLENVKDPNTDPDATREINIKIKIKPDLDRDRVVFAFQITPKEAPLSAMIGIAELGRDEHGKMIAHELDRPKQMSLIDMKTKKEGTGND